MKLSKKLIKQYIPNGFYDGTRLGGISLRENSYDLFYSENEGKYIMRTNSSNPLIGILRDNFDVIYVGRFWMHYDTYEIRLKKK